MTRPLVPHYSGSRSRRFWARIHAIREDAVHGRLYLAGCRLQTIEQRLLVQLKQAERKAE